MVRKIAASTIVIAVLVAAALSAQGRWAQPYKNGVEAFDDGKWREAVGFFLEAIRLDPRPGRSKLVEGVIRLDYFPYYYLGVAQLKLNDLERADANLKRAAEGPQMPPALDRALKQYQIELAAALANNNKPRPTAAPTPSPTSAPPPPPPVTPSPTPVNPPPTPSATPANLNVTRAPDPRFVDLANQAQVALDRNSFQEAISLFDRARLIDQAEFARRNLGAKREEARRGQAQQQLLADAKAKSIQFLEGGRTLAQQGRYAEAESQYRAATASDPNNSEAAGALDASQRFGSLRDSGKRLQREGKLQAATSPLQDARSLDPARFQAEGLDRILREIESSLTPPAPAVVPHLAEIRAGLIAYFEGDLQKAITQLSTAAADDGGLAPKLRADVHAYLGFAYASQALISPDGDARKQAQDKAVSEYRRALVLQPEYQLSDRLVSPRVKELLGVAKAPR